MNPFNPNWEEQLSKEYAQFIDESVFKYRNDEVESIEEWKNSFPLQYPVEIEIGSNRGRFILGLAKARKDTQFVGIELKKSLVRLSNNKLKRENLTHAKVINADARLAIPILFKPASIDAIYVLFPDPWWKKKHAKRKLLNPHFFELARQFMRPNACFVLKTDVLDYFNDVKSQIENDPGFQIIDNEEIPHKDSWELTTRERYCVADNTPYYLLAAKRV